MKRNKKGISLITLVITIIIMIILAAAIVLTLTQSGILDKANEATGKYNLQQVQKIAELAWAEAYADNVRDVSKLQDAVDKALETNKLNDKYEAIADEKGVTVKEKGQGGGSASTAGTITFEDAQKDEMLQKTVNSKTFDEYGNQIVIPAGFKIRVDSDAGILGDEKTTATNVTQGIVVEDKDGNQFVWVPVGKIYTDTKKTESLAKTITLGRYAYFTYWDPELSEEFTINDYVPDENGVYTPTQTASNYAEPITINADYSSAYFTEDTAQNHDFSLGNGIARNIGDFVESSMQNKGYYIGRFEAGKENGKLVCKAGREVYNFIIQPDASNVCKEMYNSGADGYNANTFSSDLINSYAWDTATIFIQIFGGESEYYKQNKSTRFTTTGGIQDEYCNINDMSGNAYEWSTETFSIFSYNQPARGGHYFSDIDRSDNYTSFRGDSMGTAPTYNNASFRPILYVAATE